MSHSLWPYGLRHTRFHSFTVSQSLLKFTSIESVTNRSSATLFYVFNLSQHQGPFQWLSFLHQVAKVLEIQLHEEMGPNAMISVLWMLSFKSAFSLFSFTLIKRLFSSSSLSAVRVVLSAYLRLLVFLLEILIPACNSSSPSFHVMYSAYKLIKQSDNIYSFILLPSLFWTSSFIKVLTIASWPTYRFLKRQVKWSGIPISSTVCSVPVKGFIVVNEAEVNVFMEFPCFCYDPTNAGYLISGTSAFSKSACTSGSSQFTSCWSLVWRILSIALLAVKMSATVW